MSFVFKLARGISTHSGAQCWEERRRAKANVKCTRGFSASGSRPARPTSVAPGSVLHWRAGVAGARALGAALAKRRRGRGGRPSHRTREGLYLPNGVFTNGVFGGGCFIMMRCRAVELWSMWS